MESRRRRELGDWTMPRYVRTQAMPNKSIHARRTTHTADVNDRADQRHSVQPPRRRQQSNYD